MLFDKNPIGTHLSVTNLFVPVNDKHTTEEDYVQVFVRTIEISLREITSKPSVYTNDEDVLSNSVLPTVKQIS